MERKEENNRKQGEKNMEQREGDEKEEDNNRKQGEVSEKEKENT
jgi:hypothetical protein